MAREQPFNETVSRPLGQNDTHIIKMPASVSLETILIWFSDPASESAPSFDVSYHFQPYLVSNSKIIYFFPSKFLSFGSGSPGRLKTGSTFQFAGIFPINRLEYHVPIDLAVYQNVVLYVAYKAYISSFDAFLNIQLIGTQKRGRT